MRKIIKVTFVTILSFLSFVLIILFGFYFWLSYRIDDIIDKKTYNSLVTNISSSENLPDRFYQIFKDVTGSDVDLTANKFLFHKAVSVLYRDKYKNNFCPSIAASYRVKTKTIDNITIGLALDKDVTRRKCTDYYLSEFDFNYSIIGIKNASKVYYHKDIQQLTDEEMMELSVMTLNPILYNKIRRPEYLNKKVEEIKLKIKNCP